MLCVLTAIIAGSSIIINRECNFYIDWLFLTIFDKINFIFFLSGSSELYATSSHDDVRVWHADTGKELLRVTNSNMICHAVCITPDGKAIITGNESNYN